MNGRGYEPLLAYLGQSHDSHLFEGGVLRFCFFFDAECSFLYHLIVSTFVKLLFRSLLKINKHVGPVCVCERIVCFCFLASHLRPGVRSALWENFRVVAIAEPKL